jgi:isopenicillin N synthase-like dioxygenase
MLWRSHTYADVCLSAVSAAEHVVHTLNCMSAVSLGLDPEYFDRFFAPGDYSLRLAHYPPMMAEAAPGQLRYGAHTDYQGFTVLLQDDRCAMGRGAGGGGLHGSVIMDD